jgi:hypothetical protein
LVKKKIRLRLLGVKITVISKTTVI